MVDNLLTKLLEVSRHKEKLMNQMLHVSKQLADSSDDWESYEKYLGIRQKYIKEIDGLDQQLNMLKEKTVTFIGVSNWDGVKEFHPGMVEEIEQCWKLASKTAEESFELTEQSMIQVERNLKELQHNMKTLQSSKTGVTAYKKRIKQNSGYFLDKKK